MAVFPDDERRTLVAEQHLLDQVVRAARVPGPLHRSTLDAVLLGAHEPPPRAPATTPGALQGGRLPLPRSRSRSDA